MTVDLANERAMLIQKLADFPEELAALVAGLTPAQLTTVYLPDEWTVAQNVHHLFDSHARGYLNCKLILTEEEPPLKRYPLPTDRTNVGCRRHSSLGNRPITESLPSARIG